VLENEALQPCQAGSPGYRVIRSSVRQVRFTSCSPKAAPDRKDMRLRRCRFDSRSDIQFGREAGASDSAASTAVVVNAGRLGGTRGRKPVLRSALQSQRQSRLWPPARPLKVLQGVNPVDFGVLL
jgi:hypothetical protein